MKNCLLHRGFILIIIVIFLVTSVASSMGRINNEIEKTDIDVNKSLMCLSNNNPPYPPVMWTEDFEIFHITNPKPDGDPIFYWVDWGDGNNSEWLGPYDPDETVTISHIWSNNGTYQIKVKAKNQHGESRWTFYCLMLWSDFKFFGIGIGYVSITYTFTIYWKGYEYFMLDWGDGTTPEWLGPYNETLLFYRTWSSPGMYEFRMKAKNINGNETNWSEPIIITILPLEGPILEIEIITGFYIGAIIKNVGDEDAYNVEWYISVKGGILDLVSVSEEGNIYVIPNSDLIGTAVRLHQLVFGFGIVEITVTAVGENTDIVTEKINGLLILFWIIQLSEI